MRLAFGARGAKLLSRRRRESYAQFVNRLKDAWPAARQWVAQEMLITPPEGEAVWWGVRFANGAIKGITAFDRWMQPSLGGTGCWVETSPNAALLPIAEAVLKTIDYRGPAELQFLLDRRGKWRLLELNPRAWLQAGLANKAGLPVAALTYRDLIGETVDIAEIRPSRATQGWVNPERMLIAALTEKRDGGRWQALRTMWRAWRRTDYTAIYSSPLPHLRWRWLRRLFARLVLVNHSRVSTLIGPLFVAASFGWIGWLLYRDRVAILPMISQWTGVNYLWLALSVLIGSLSLVSLLPVFSRLVATHTDQPIAGSSLARIFFVSQLVRYLPGRFMGVAYQVNSARGWLPARTVITANIELLLFACIFNGLAAVLILCAFASLSAAAGVAIAAGALIFLYLRSNWMQRLLNLLTVVKPSLSYSLPKSRRLDNAEAAEILVLYGFSWLLYAGAWLCLSRVFSSLDAGLTLKLCAAYTISWAIGFLSLVTPGGLGIREATFIYIGRSLASGAQLVFLSLFLRLWLIVMDVAVASGTLLRLNRFRPIAWSSAPAFDQHGLNVLDPHDKLGRKSEYITLLQGSAMMRYLPSGDNHRIAVDLGCGYGRLTPFIAQKGWETFGIDPDATLIDTARQLHPALAFRQGGLPDLPFEEHSVGLLVMHNVARSLQLMGRLNWIAEIGRYMLDTADIYLVENIRAGHPDYVREEQLVGMLETQGFELRRHVPIRTGRRLMTYLIWFGLVPRRFFQSIALKELDTMQRRTVRPSRQYYNVLFHFQRSPAKARRTVDRCEATGGTIKRAASLP